MKKQHYVLIATGLFLALFSISSSCKRHKYCEKKSGTCRSVLEAKDFFLFKQGSWWVYEEEHTHQRDSQYVYEYNNTSGYDFDMRVHSTLEDYDYHYWPLYASGAIETCSENEPVSGRCVTIKRNKAKIGDYIGEADCFFVNYNIGDEKYTYGGPSFNQNKITVINIFDSYSLGNFMFDNVVQINELNTVIEGQQPTKHFFCSKIGLIRKELIDSNQVWNLVNYHVEQ